ncbi:flagellin [Nocardioides sp. CN2-186]|uniref:flagellin N-terminal helical domain-containing protein n=1 Tax=Nocardioides tweenelious TaxID=3156607 RepID=UPI0032B4D967
MTQSMLSHQALGGMQTAMGRVAKAQEQLTTGRIINRPSDDPSGATTAMRIRSSMAMQDQYVRNGDDAVGWLNQADGTLTSVTDQVRRAREIALQGANDGAMGQDARDALATEIDQIRQGLVSSANTTYLDRPIFGGLTAGGRAYDYQVPGDSSTQVDFIGLSDPNGVVRTIADGAKVRVDVEGPDVFGQPNDTVFDHLTALAASLRSGNTAGITSAVDSLAVDGTRVTNVQAEIGARTNRVERAQSVATDSALSLKSSLSEVENTDLAKATVDLGLQNVAYQAALGATARVIQPSLLDFLR